MKPLDIIFVVVAASILWVVIFFGVASVAHCQGLCLPFVCGTDAECASPGCHCAKPLGSGVGVCS